MRTENLSRRPRTNWLPVGVALLAGSGAFGQSTLSPGQAANSWMWSTAATQSQKALSVDAQTRAQRDQFADAIFGMPAALTATTAGWSHIAQDPGAADYTKIPELPTVPNRAIVIAGFQSYQSRLSASQRSVYTEVSFAVEKVFDDATGTLKAGSLVSAMLPGGSVQTANGNLNFLLDPLEYSTQPGGRYLLVLSYNTTGNFYLVTKFWELTGGSARAGSKLEAARVKAGKATISGSAESQIAGLLAAIVSTAK